MGIAQSWREENLNILWTSTGCLILLLRTKGTSKELLLIWKLMVTLLLCVSKNLTYLIGSYYVVGNGYKEWCPFYSSFKWGFEQLQITTEKITMYFGWLRNDCQLQGQCACYGLFIFSVQEWDAFSSHCFFIFLYKNKISNFSFFVFSGVHELMDVVGDQYCFTGVMREGTGKGRMCAASLVDAQRGTVCCWPGGGLAGWGSCAVMSRS